MLALERKHILMYYLLLKSELIFVILLSLYSFRHKNFLGYMLIC